MSDLQELKVDVVFRDNQTKTLTIKTRDFYNFIENKNSKSLRFMIFKEGAYSLDLIHAIIPHKEDALDTCFVDL